MNNAAKSGLELARPISNPHFWRDLADRARIHSRQIEDKESKSIIVAIADAYERLARRAEEILRGQKTK